MEYEHSKPFNRWIFETYTVSSEGLGLFRIIASLFILYFLIPGMGLDHYRYLASLPPDFYNPPPGPLMLFDGFPPLFVYQAVYAAILISVFGMLVGYRTKLTSILSGIFILMMQGLIFSIGKINHEILVPLVPILMAFSNWGESFSIDSFRPERKASGVHSWPLVLLSVFIGFMMFTAGLPKILGGWLDPFTHAVRGHLFNQYFVHEREAFLAGAAIQIKNPVFWECLDWFTIIFEVGFLLSILKAKWFRVFLMFAVFFHFSTQMLLNISFLPNFLAYSAFLNWQKIYQTNKQLYGRLTGRSSEKARRMSVAWFVGFVIVLFSVLKWVSSYQLFLVETDLMLHEPIFLFFAVLVVLYILFKHLTERKRVKAGSLK